MSTTEENLEKLERQHAEMGKQIQLLRDQVAQEKETLAGLQWKPKARDQFSTVTRIGCRPFEGFTYHASDFPSLDTPVFQTKQQASDYAEVFNVILELRAQPGVVELKEKGTPYYIIKTEAPKIYVSSREFINGSSVLGCLSPPFKNHDAACNAMFKVGQDRILKAAKTLALLT